MATEVQDALNRPLGYEQITDLSAATGLTVPAGANRCLLLAETQSVRWRDDGDDPTASVGMLLPTNTAFWYAPRDLAAVKFIETAASAKLNIAYYD